MLVVVVKVFSLFAEGEREKFFFLGMGGKAEGREEGEEERRREEEGMNYKEPKGQRAGPNGVSMSGHRHHFQAKAKSCLNPEAHRPVPPPVIGLRHIHGKGTVSHASHTAPCHTNSQLAYFAHFTIRFRTMPVLCF